MIRGNTIARRLLLALLVVLCAACGDDDPSAGGTAAPPPVTQGSVSLPGSIAPANPETGATTAAELNRAYAQTYQRADVGDAEITKVLVLMPGFLGGANDFDYMARRVIERSAGRTAVWAVDRRSNALEDQTGLDAAEAARNPDIAKDYYFHGTEVQGRRFAGFLSGTSVSFESEWGIRTHIEDLDAVITEAIRHYPTAAVILGGHSLGGSIVPIYAAWNFGDHVGFERLSGVVLLEGAPNPQPGAAAPAQADYETRGLGTGLTRTSLKKLRSGDPVAGLQPFAGIDIFVTAEIAAMRTSSLFGDPLGLSPDTDLGQSFYGLLFGLRSLPPMTNRAAFAFGFDNDYEPLFFVRASVGEAIGPVGPNPNLPFFVGLGLVGPDDHLLAPIDAAATYDWRPPSAQAMPDATDLDTLARLLFAGPTNFIEWYFPARLTFDVGVAGTLNVQRSGDWRKEVYGMAVTENARVDVPVFAVGGSKGLVPDVSVFAPYRDSISPTLRNGTARTAIPAGFQTRLQEGYAHLDVITARDEGAGNGELAALVDWMDAAVQLAPPRR